MGMGDYSDNNFLVEDSSMRKKNDSSDEYSFCLIVILENLRQML